MLGDFSRCPLHIRGLPRENVDVGAEEVDERAYLFGCQTSADPDNFPVGVGHIDRYLLHVVRRLEGADTTLGVWLSLAQPLL